MNDQVKVEFLEDYLNCHKKGDRRTVTAAFAKVLLFYKFAKIISGPPRDKMVYGAEKIKTHNV